MAALDIHATVVQAAVRGKLRRSELQRQGNPGLQRRTDFGPQLDPLHRASAAASGAHVELDDHVQLRFDQLAFFRELVYNMLWPLSVPLVLHIEGWYGAQFRLAVPRFGRVGVERSRGLCGFLAQQLLLMMISALPPAMFWYLVGFLCLSDADSSLGLFEVVNALACMLLHRLVIATKYALLTREEYLGLRARPHHEGVQYNLQLAGWSEQKAETVLLHLCKAEIRMERSLHEVEVVLAGAGVQLPRELPLLVLELASDGRDAADAAKPVPAKPVPAKPVLAQPKESHLFGSQRVSNGVSTGVSGGVSTGAHHTSHGQATLSAVKATTRVQHLIRKRLSVFRLGACIYANSLEVQPGVSGSVPLVLFLGAAHPVSYLILIVSLCASLLPGAYRVLVDGLPWLGSAPHEAAAAVCAMMLTYMFTGLSLFFLYIAHLDFSRRALQIETLTQMIAEHSDLGVRRLGGLRFSLSDPSNTAALVQLLAFLNEVGRPFLLREASFALFFVVLLVLRFGYICIAFIGTSFLRVPLDGAGTLTSAVEITAVCLLIDAVLVSVGACNEATARLLRALSRAKVALLDPRGRSSKLDAEAVAAAVEMLASAHEAISQQRHDEPFSFCGMQSTTPLLRGVMSASTLLLSLIAASAGYSTI